MKQTWFTPFEQLCGPPLEELSFDILWPFALANLWPLCIDFDPRIYTCKWFCGCLKGRSYKLSFEIHWVTVNPFILILLNQPNGWNRLSRYSPELLRPMVRLVPQPWLRLHPPWSVWQPLQLLGGQTVSFWWRICAQAAGVKKVLKSKEPYATPQNKPGKKIISAKVTSNFNLDRKHLPIRVWSGAIIHWNDEHSVQYRGPPFRSTFLSTAAAPVQHPWLGLYSLGRCSTGFVSLFGLGIVQRHACGDGPDGIGSVGSEVMWKIIGWFSRCVQCQASRLNQV